MTIPATGRPENRFRPISARTDQKMITSQTRAFPHPFGQSWMHLGEKQRANASWPTSVTRNATFEADALSSMRSHAPFYDLYRTKSSLCTKCTVKLPIRKTQQLIWKLLHSKAIMCNGVYPKLTVFILWF